LFGVRISGRARNVTRTDSVRLPAINGAMRVRIPPSESS